MRSNEDKSRYLGPRADDDPLRSRRLGGVECNPEAAVTDSNAIADYSLGAAGGVVERDRADGESAHDVGNGQASPAVGHVHQRD